MASRVAVAVALAALGSVGAAVAAATPAEAGEGMEVLCQEPGWSCVGDTGYRGQGLWGANHGRTGHNCTSYVSYRLAQRGVEQPWRPMGDAGRWDDNALRHGTVVDDRPAVGAVAQWDGGSRISRGSSGHVAYVDAVTADAIELSDDSYGGTTTRRFRITRGSPYWPQRFVHIADELPEEQPLTDGRWALAGTHPAASAPPAVVEFGLPGDLPVVGDWDGDGRDTVGVFRDGTWSLADVNDGARMRVRSFTFGRAGDLPVAGDWDGDGRDTVGVFRDGTWLLARANRVGTRLHVVELGQPGDLPVVGDWDGDGRDTIGTQRGGEWTTTDSPVADPNTLDRFAFGLPGDRPVAGDWDGRRGDSVGVFRDGRFLLASDNASAPGQVRTVTFGTADDVPLAGRWGRRGADAVGTAR